MYAKNKKMKRQFKTFFFLLLILGCSQSPNNSKNDFVLKGKTNNLVDGTQILLFDLETNQVCDSTIIKNNEFLFHGTLKSSPYQMIVQTKDLSQYKFLWVENKEMLFDASTSNFRFATITGSEIQKLSDKLYNSIDTLKDRHKGQLLEMKFVEEHPNSIVSASILSVYSTTWGKPKVKALFDRFSKENKETIYGKKVNKYLNLSKNPKIGEKFVDFKMENQDGELFSLSNHLGRVTLLEFWASWCGPCREENPNLVKTYKNFHKDGFEVFAVSLDKDEISWKNAIKEDGLIWNQVSDLEGQNNTAGLIYGINGIPDNFLLNEEGVIVGRNLRGERLNEEIAKLLSPD